MEPSTETTPLVNGSGEATVYNTAVFTTRRSLDGVRSRRASFNYSAETPQKETGGNQDAVEAGGGDGVDGRRKLMGWEVACVCLGLFAINMQYNTLSLLRTPYFGRLGLSVTYVSYTSAAHFVTSMLLMPWWGLQTDRQGKVIPTAVAMLAASGVSLLVFPTIRWLDIADDAKRWVAALWLVPYYLLYEAAKQVMLTYVTREAEQAQQARLAGYTSAAFVSGSLLSAVLCGLDWEALLCSSQDCVFNGVSLTDIDIAFFVTALCVFVCCLVLFPLIFTEVGLTEDDADKDEVTSFWRSISDSFDFAAVPAWFWPTLIAMALGWGGFFVMFHYLTELFGTSLLGGSPTARLGTVSYKAYDEGVHWAGYCLLLQRAVACGSALCLSFYATSDDGVWMAWAVSSALSASGATIAATAQSGTRAGLLTALDALALTGPLFGALIALPSNVIGRHAQVGQQGALMGYTAMANYGAQSVAAIFVAPALLVASQDDVRVMFGCWGLCSFAAVIVAVRELVRLRG